MKVNIYWIFGYGSIIWDNNDIKPIKTIDAELIGAHRSFNKKSIVTRGTKEFPGLALGLEYGGKCYGKAFLINEESYKVVQKREGGYEEIKTPNKKLKILNSKGRVIEGCTVFFPNSSGKNYLNSETSLQEKANIIINGKDGTKGNSKDYLKQIKVFLNEYNIEDEEVESLYALVFENSQYFVKQKLEEFNLEFFQNKNRREGVDFIIKTNTGNLHEVYVQSINLNKERSVKILKQDLGEPKDTFWVALVLIMDNKPISFYLIPTKTLTKPDDFVFIENEVSSFPQLSNWEIKVFKNGMEKLNEFSLENMLDKLK